jgi:hypothetical protein
LSLSSRAAPPPMAKIVFAVLLIGLQTVIVFGGWFRPDATPDYSATYITRSMDCWLPPGTPAFLPSADIIVPLELSQAQACALMPKGWAPKDTSQVWSNGKIAKLDIPLRPNDAQVTLRLAGYSQHAAQQIEIIQAGAAPLHLQIPPGTIAKIVIPLKPGSLVLRLQIHIAYVHNPLDRDITDWRAIGIALLDITRTAGSNPPKSDPSTPSLRAQRGNPSSGQPTEP